MYHIPLSSGSMMREVINVNNNQRGDDLAGSWMLGWMVFNDATNNTNPK